jgi:hypothetical protein
MRYPTRCILKCFMISKHKNAGNDLHFDCRLNLASDVS